MSDQAEKTFVTVDNALQVMQRSCELMPRDCPGMTLAVETFSPGWVGATPHCRITHLQPGFDWDSKLMLLKPEKPLTTLSPEDMASIRESVRLGESWHAQMAYKKSSADIRQLKHRVKVLSAERSHLLDAVPLNWSEGAAAGTAELRLGSNLAGAVRRMENNLFAVRSTLPGSTLEYTDQPTFEAAKATLEKICSEWLKGLLS